MRRFSLIVFLTFGFTTFLVGQKLKSSLVPKELRDVFNQSFPKAKDISWKKKGDLYEVEFEEGLWNNDRTAWFNQQGEQLGLKEDIPKRKLPEKILNAISKNYKYFWILDVEKLSYKGTLTYEVDMKSFTKQWKVVFTPQGEEVSKVSD
ncbi:MAG TPA: PepSY-like domain-containing protein [Candidatus Sphingobacterium stercoripullorum]|uniref:PepSY-like domain-containing protein n=1 Tax=Candidatus Sphingobacterium stercoripullorum TaxID=2838759 RepID=A0A9D2AYS6_9SPHI|nr:PepSY-like domain-containing protein [Candidatus Sphingobacterium stercoripullorum]